MSVEADRIRTRRQHFAAPGGVFDRVVRTLAIVLPALIGATAAALVIAPLSPRGEISFLLDRNKVAVANDRLRVDEAVYRGSDQKGRPFTLSAGSAVQASASVQVVEMRDLTARIDLADGPAVLSAPAGSYNIQHEQVTVADTVHFAAADGYRMTLSGITVDLPRRRAVGTGGVEGAIPAGTFSARTLEADFDQRIVALSGDARLRMVPGKMKMP